MPRYRLNGNYGTFAITKVIEARDRGDAELECGIVVDLVEAGWSFIGPVEGEEWVIEEVG